MSSRERRDREITAWAQMRGADRNDFTPAQRERFMAWEKCGHDELLAAFLIVNEGVSR